MRDAPETVRLSKSISGQLVDFGDKYGTEYTRTDIAQAAVAAALEQASAVRVHSAADGEVTHELNPLIAAAIRALATPEQTAALAEVRRQARVEGMREAMEACKGVGSPVGAGDGYGTYIRGTSADAERAIAALIAREGG